LDVETRISPELEGIDPVWLNAEHTRFAWGPYRPWQEDPDFIEVAEEEIISLAAK